MSCLALVAMSLIKHLKNLKLNKTIRFIFIPETIGSITYLSKNLNKLKSNVIGGYNLSCIGDERQHFVCCLNTKIRPDKALLEAYKKLKLNLNYIPF